MVLHKVFSSIILFLGLLLPYPLSSPIRFLLCFRPVYFILLYTNFNFTKVTIPREIILLLCNCKILYCTSLTSKDLTIYYRQHTRSNKTDLLRDKIGTVLGPHFTTCQPTTKTQRSTSLSLIRFSVHLENDPNRWVRSFDDVTQTIYSLKESI